MKYTSLLLQPASSAQFLGSVISCQSQLPLFPHTAWFGSAYTVQGPGWASSRPFCWPWSRPSGLDYLSLTPFQGWVRANPESLTIWYLVANWFFSPNEVILIFCLALIYLLNISVNSYLLKIKIEPLDLYWMMQKYKKKEQKLRELLEKCRYKWWFICCLDPSFFYKKNSSTFQYNKVEQTNPDHDANTNANGEEWWWD